MKQGFRLLSAAILFVIVSGAANLSYGQTPTPTPTPPPGVDTFITQLTASTRNSFAGDISANGRFVVVESNGDISTEKTIDGRNNADGNREIFLIDYAQRRIFQITNTTSVRIDTTKTFTEATNNILYEISNNRPRLTYAPAADGAGRRVYSIVFSSNAPNPASFTGEGNSAAITADGNQEVWIYQLPQVLDNLDLSSGADLARIDLAQGAFLQVTNTPPSRPLQAGTATRSPDVIDDNREAFINDDGTIVAFTSTRCAPRSGAVACPAGSTNTDANPEIFIYNRTTDAFTQVTNTASPSPTSPVVNQNPNLSGDGTRLAFISNANITANNADGNMEIYVGEYNGAAVSGLRQVTRTASASPGISVNILSPGRRMSRDGTMLAFESSSEDPKNNGAIQAALGTFIYNIVTDTFTSVGTRPTVPADVLRFPTFTGDNSRLVFTSVINYRADGGLAATPNEGLNPSINNILRPQLFTVLVATPNAFRILTNIGITNGSSFQPFVGQTIQRISFSLATTELGGGNPDNSTETFYLLTPPTATDTNGTLSFFTFPSQRPVVTNPTPPAVAGLSPGMHAIVRSTTSLAPSNATVTNASESLNRPPLPTELNGVSLEIGGAAAGLYFVSPGEIQFVVPPGLVPNTLTNTYPVVINNNGSVIRSTVQILPAQPDIYTTTQDAGGRAFVFNVTNPMVETPEPFTVTTTYLNAQGQTVTEPTKLRIILTGVRGVTKSQITVRIGTVDLTGNAILTDALPRDMPGFYQIDVQLPATLAGAGDVPIVVSVVSGTQTFTSRPLDTAPRITIN